MKNKKSFYDTGFSNGYLQEGSRIEVSRSLTYYGANADFTPFIGIPIKELEKQQKASIAEEKKVYEQLQKAVDTWIEHGAQTLLLKKAIEYLKTPVVKHTNNRWVHHKDDTWEISNLVYKMTYTIVYSECVWKLSWELEYTSPGYTPPTYYSPYDNRPRPRIEREGSKKYKTLEGAQKYIQGKFDEYAHLFMEVSPPIPEDAKIFFCVNGQLLQGYTLAPKERTSQEVADELFGLLEETDLAPDAAVEPPKATEKPASNPDPPKGKEKPTHKKAAAKKQAVPER